MGPKKPVDPILIKLSKLKKKPVPTLFTLSVNQDMPDKKPELAAEARSSFVSCKCSCEKALNRFASGRNVISDGIFDVLIMCSTNVAVTRAVRVYEQFDKLKPQTEDENRQKGLKKLVHEFAGHCEHIKIRRKVAERIPYFVAYPVIPRCRVDRDGVPVMDSDPCSDEVDEKPDEPVDSDCQAVYNWTTVINNALAEKLRQKLPLSPRQPKSELPGYIYILKSPRAPDMLKIGFTKKDPAVRREQWDRCYPNIEVHAYTSLVPYAKLVEHLIHTELVTQRHTDDCSTCKGKKTRPRSHNEWFRTTEQLAEQTVIRWAKWMGSRPYHTDTRTLMQKWDDRLKKAQKKAYMPGVDHITYTGNTWQTFTDMRRPKGARDDSGAVELTRCMKGKSPFSA